METWGLILLLLITILMLFIKNHRMERMEQRILNNEKMIHLLAHKLGIDPDIVRHLDHDPLMPYKEDLMEVIQIKKAEKEQRQKEINEELLGLLRNGKKIEAIKQVRQVFDLGLKEAKDYVDRLERKL
jgi:hypothetical protein